MLVALFSSSKFQPRRMIHRTLHQGWSLAATCGAGQVFFPEQEVGLLLAKLQDLRRAAGGTVDEIRETRMCFPRKRADAVLKIGGMRQFFGI